MLTELKLRDVNSWLRSNPAEPSWAPIRANRANLLRQQYGVSRFVHTWSANNVDSPCRTLLGRDTIAVGQLADLGWFGIVGAVIRCPTFTGSWSLDSADPAALLLLDNGEVTSLLGVGPVALIMALAALRGPSPWQPTERFSLHTLREPEGEFGHVIEWSGTINSDNNMESN